TAAELLRDGPKDNIHVRVTGLVFDRNYAVAAYRRKYSDERIWTHVFIPAYAQAPAGRKPVLNLFVKAELTSTDAVAQFCRKPELTGSRTQAVWPLTSSERETLQGTFPSVNPDAVMVLDVAPREYPRGSAEMRAWLILGLMASVPACLVGFIVLAR